MACDADCDGTPKEPKLASGDLPEAHLRFILSIVKEPVEAEGLGAIELFMAVRQDARLLSLLELALRICSDDLDQLLFAAEDYYSEAARHSDGSA